MDTSWTCSIQCTWMALPSVASLRGALEPRAFEIESSLVPPNISPAKEYPGQAFGRTGPITSASLVSTITFLLFE